MFSPEECQRSLRATEQKLVRATLDFTLTRQKLKRLTDDIEKFKKEVGRLTAMLSPGPSLSSAVKAIEKDRGQPIEPAANGEASPHRLAPDGNSTVATKPAQSRAKNSKADETLK